MCIRDRAWEAYVRVNERFCDAVVAVARPGDVVWVQDYHLMLLPSLVRAAVPEAQVGFFLHIPFPDYETFRMLPWRAELVHGVLGADLIGFHAYDYVRHFLSSCRQMCIRDRPWSDRRPPGSCRWPWRRPA